LNLSKKSSFAEQARHDSPRTNVAPTACGALAPFLGLPRFATLVNSRVRQHHIPEHVVEDFVSHSVQHIQMMRRELGKFFSALAWSSAFRHQLLAMIIFPFAAA
jgi:hypothetical protein